MPAWASGPGCTPDRAQCRFHRHWDPQGGLRGSLFAGFVRRCGELPQNSWPRRLAGIELALCWFVLPQPYCAIGCGPCARVEPVWGSGRRWCAFHANSWTEVVGSGSFKAEDRRSVGMASHGRTHPEKCGEGPRCVNLRVRADNAWKKHNVMYCNTNAIQSNAMQCNAMQCHVMSCHVMSCHVM